MRYREYRPPPCLSPYIECFWFLVDECAAADRPLERIFPDGCMEVILHLREPFHRWMEAGLPDIQETAFLVGGMTRFMVLQPPRLVETMGIRFRPGGAHAFFPFSLDEVMDRTVPLEAIWGNFARDLYERLVNARSHREMVRVAGEAFLLRMDIASRETSRQVGAAIRQIVRSCGRTPVPALAEHAGLSSRQLERRFCAMAGMGVKTLSRIIRFQNVFRQLESGREVDWARIALDCGYFDQAHLIGDCKRFSGETPASLAAGTGMMTTHFTSPERLAALFAPSSGDLGDDVAFFQYSSRGA